MQKVRLTLRNVKLKSYHIICWLIAILNLLIQAYLTFSDKHKHDKILVGSFLTIIILFSIIARGNNFGFKDKNYKSGFVYGLICFIWFKWGLYWILATNILFYFLYISAKRKFEIIFTADMIIYPSFPKRNILWNELQNVILKDGILTIDFKTDKIFQNEITDEDFINEKEFNDFCRDQLKSAATPI